jgi:putative transcriptional regulator
MMQYFAIVTNEDSRRLVEFPDCPGCQTFVEPGEDVELVGREALEGWLETTLQEREVPPRPMHRTGLAVTLNALLALKLRLRWLRADLGLTQAQLAQRAGVSQQMIAKLEDADYSPGLEIVEKVARAFGATADVIFHRPLDEELLVHIVRAHTSADSPIIWSAKLKGILTQAQVAWGDPHGWPIRRAEDLEFAGRGRLLKWKFKNRVGFSLSEAADPYRARAARAEAREHGWNQCRRTS